jgi:hypothetical protein
VYGTEEVSGRLPLHAPQECAGEFFLKKNIVVVFFVVKNGFQVLNVAQVFRQALSRLTEKLVMHGKKISFSVHCKMLIFC